MISIAALFCGLFTILPKHVIIQVTINSITFACDCEGFAQAALAVFATIFWFARHAKFCQRYPVGYPLFGWMRRRCDALNTNDRG
jgi:hypothetical protein